MSPRLLSVDSSGLQFGIVFLDDSTQRKRVSSEDCLIAGEQAVYGKRSPEEITVSELRFGDGNPDEFGFLIGMGTALNAFRNIGVPGRPV